MKLEQVEVDKLYKQLAYYICHYGWLLISINKTNHKFKEQNYLNIAYGLNQSTITYYTHPTNVVDIMDLFDRNLFRNIIFEYLDVYFGENNRKFKDIIITPEIPQDICIIALDKESRDEIIKALEEILPEYFDYIDLIIENED